MEISPYLQHFLFLSPPAVDWIGSGMGGFTSVLTPSPILDVDIGVIGSSFMTVSSVERKNLHGRQDTLLNNSQHKQNWQMAVPKTHFISIIFYKIRDTVSTMLNGKAGGMYHRE